MHLTHQKLMTVALCTITIKIARVQNAMISVAGKEIVIVGFNEGVEQARGTLSSFVQLKNAHFKKMEEQIDPLIAKCMHGDVAGLQNCMASMSVTCTIDATTASVTITPTKETEHDWREKCKDLLTAYIEKCYLKADIEIPKAASTEIFQILHSTGNQSTFHFELHNHSSHAIVAGEKSIVHSVQT